MGSAFNGKFSGPNHSITSSKKNSVIGNIRPGYDNSDTGSGSLYKQRNGLKNGTNVEPAKVAVIKTKRKSDDKPVS